MKKSTNELKQQLSNPFAKEKKEKKEFYLNPIAILFLLAKQTIKILIAGRGFGKSFLMGISIMIKLYKLPRSRGLLIGATYTQILTNILLPMKSAWIWFGYKEGEDYVIGKRPPQWFAEPYQKPDRYENVITWWNGTTIILASMDRPQLIRGGNYDWSLADEGLLIKQEEYQQIIVPTIRGSHILFHGREGHLSQEIYSSMPYGTMGTWLLDKKIEAQNPDNDTFYIEGTSWHNRKVLTDKVLKMWKRTMNRIIYMIEVMNKRIRQYGNVFYPALKEKHWYKDTYNYDFIDTLGTDPERLKRDCRWDNDFDPGKEIIISHDFGAFNCITIAQEHDEDPMFGMKQTTRVINFMHTEHPRIMQDLAREFCEYYQYTKIKRVRQFGDKSGNKSEANSRLTYFEEFSKILEDEGWLVLPEQKGDVGHLARHQFIIEMHREEETRLPAIRYNANNCKDLRIALESAGMIDDKKDKRSERNKNIKQQHATHGTDAHDYFLWHAYRHLIQDRTYQSPVSFGGN